MKMKRLWHMSGRITIICLAVVVLVSCNQTKTPLRVSEPTVYEINKERVVRIGEIIHSNRTRVNGSAEIVTHEVELAGIHSGYGATTVINLIYRKIDADGKNISRPRVINHKMSDGLLISLGGAQIEILEFKIDYVSFIVRRDFDQVLNR